MVELSSKIKNARMEDLKTANSVIVKLAATHTKMLFPKIEGKLKIVTHSEAAFRTLPDQVSSGGGHLGFLTSEKEQEAATLGWTSNKVKRVVGSNLAAEALSLQEAVSHAIYLRGILAEVLEKEEKEIPMVSYVSSNNLYQAVHSNKFVEDKKMRLDIAQVRECIEEERLEVSWIQAEEMLARCLTRKGADGSKLMTVLKKGKLPRRKRGEIKKEDME